MTCHAKTGPWRVSCDLCGKSWDKDDPSECTRTGVDLTDEATMKDVTDFITGCREKEKVFIAIGGNRPDQTTALDYLDAALSRICVLEERLQELQAGEDW